MAKVTMIRSLLNSVDYPVMDRMDELLELVTSMTEGDDRSLMLEEISVFLAKRGSYEQAFKLLGQIDGKYEKAEGLISVAEILMADNQADRAKSLLKEAETVACLIETKWQIGELLERIARAFISLRDKSTAIRILDNAVLVAREGEKGTDSLDSSSVLWDISITFFKLGERDKAIEIAEAISDEGKRKRAIETILETHSKNKREDAEKRSLISQELIGAIRSFPLAREVQHCGKTFSISPFDVFAICPICQGKIKARSFSALPEVEDVFDAVFEWMLQNDALLLVKKRQEEVE